MIFKNIKAGLLSLTFCHLFLIHGCIEITMTGGSIPAEAKTYSVQYFQNSASYVQPVLSQKLTDAIKDKIMSQSKLTLTEEMGDLHFEGEITAYTVAPLAITGDDQAATNRLTIRINVRFYNKFKEEDNFESSFARYEDFSSDVNLADIEDQLMDAIIEKLVDDLYNKALVNW
ncbi:MAG: LptE family protein [Bacteroidales bacterium]|nr:LptE family protein [Bacteroidales bacterium]